MAGVSFHGREPKPKLPRITYDLADRMRRCKGCACWIQPGQPFYEREEDARCLKCGREDAEDET